MRTLYYFIKIDVNTKYFIKIDVLSHEFHSIFIYFVTISKHVQLKRLEAQRRSTKNKTTNMINDMSTHHLENINSYKEKLIQYKVSTQTSSCLVYY